MNNKETNKINENRKVRFEWLDILKGILIYIVMIDHSYSDTRTAAFYTPFFLATFFWVGGYTFSMKDSFRNFITSKIKRLVVPLFALGLARVLILCVISGFETLPDRILGLILQRSFIYDEMWFLSCLFMAELIMYILLKLFSGIKKETVCYIVLIIALLLLAVLGYIIMSFRWKLIWEIETAMIMVIYTGLGYLWRKTGDKAEIFLKLPVVFGCLALYIALWLFVPIVSKIHMQEFDNIPLFFLESLLMIPVLVFVSKKLEGSIIGKIISFVGRYTLFFFAFGGFGREVFYKVTDMAGLERMPWQAFVCAIFIICIMIGPAVLFKKVFPWAMGESKRTIQDTPKI